LTDDFPDRVAARDDLGAKLLARAIPLDVLAECHQAAYAAEKTAEWKDHIGHRLRCGARVSAGLVVLTVLQTWGRTESSSQK